MSQMEYNKGVLIPRGDLTEEEAASLCKAQKEESYDPYDSFVEMVLDDLAYYAEKLEMINGKLYTVEWEVRRGDLDSLEKVQEGEDGIIQFETYHYNGGGHWTEVVEGELNK